jgi:hypothetical protein
MAPLVAVSLAACSDSPTAVDAPVAVSLSVSGNHACVILDTGALECWGYNVDGSLGAGDRVQHATPVPVAPGRAFQSVSVAGMETCGISNAQVYCWSGGTAPGEPKPGVGGAAAVGAGYFGFAAALMPGGDVYAWNGLPPAFWGHVKQAVGLYVIGYMGGGGIGPGQGPHPVNLICALQQSGVLQCMDASNRGQPVQGDTATSSAFSPVPGLLFRSVAANEGSYVCGVTTDARLYCWNRWAPEPTLQGGGLAWKSVALGLDHTCGLSPAGEALCWGRNDRGQLGTAPSTGPTVTTPQPVSGSLRFKTLGTGNQFTCGLTESGSVYCWGSNGSNQLGDGTSTDSYLPVQVIL